MKDKKGFTLTELLAVIVLIGVILAIAVPSYQSYITKTRQKVLESYQANIIDAANQYATECFAENRLGECKKENNIWSNLAIKNKGDIEKEYDVSIKINNGPSNVSEYFSINLEMTNKSTSNKTNKDTSKTKTEGTSGSTSSTTTDTSISIAGIYLNSENSTITGVFNANQILEISSGSVESVMVGNIKAECNEGATLFNTTTSCDLLLNNGKNKIKITYNDGTKKEITIVADTIAPKITTSTINSSPTNKVEFTVTITDENLESTKVPDECTITGNDSYKCTITENGAYEFSATDKAGNVTTKEIKITNITSTQPFVMINTNNELERSKEIEIEYSSGKVNEAYIGFNSNEKLTWQLIDTVTKNVVKNGNFTNLSNKGSEVITIDRLTGTYKFIAKGLTNKASNKNDDEEVTIRLDNTPPSAAVVSQPTKDKEQTKSAGCDETLDSNGNRTCKVVFYGGLFGAEVKAKLDFTVEDVGGSGIGKVYYRTSTTGNFTETTVNAINDLPHKDFNKEEKNLYIEVVFADKLGNIDYTKNITKITFVKN